MRQAGGERRQSVATGQEVLLSGRLQFRSWETNEGVKCSKVEIPSTHVGPRLTFGTTPFTKSP